MHKQIKDFVEAHPEGWGHGDWLALLTQLERDGIDVQEPEAIGASLEQARLAYELRRRSVPGLGPKRIDAVVDRFGTLWNLRHAEPEEVAELKAIPAKLAEKVVAAVR